MVSNCRSVVEASGRGWTMAARATLAPAPLAPRGRRAALSKGAAGIALVSLSPAPRASPAEQPALALAVAEDDVAGQVALTEEALAGQKEAAAFEEEVKVVESELAQTDEALASETVTPSDARPLLEGLGQQLKGLRRSLSARPGVQ